MRQQAIYLDSASGPLSATVHRASADSARDTAALHRASADSARDTAVLLCPPFGWEEVCSYRHLRTWAQQLAAAGYTTLRLSFPSTADSAGSPRDPDRLSAWTDAVQSSAGWLLDATGARRIAVVGLELGGIVAYLAAAAGAPIDDLVLWATPSRGKAVVRQLRAFSKLESARFFEGLEQPGPLPSGELEAGGFLLSAQTVEGLEALDLTARPLAPGAVPRVLLLGRDGMTVDARLQAELEQGDRQVTVASGDGYATMTSHPQSGKPALETFERVATWLGEASSVGGSASGDGGVAPSDAEVPVGGGVGPRCRSAGARAPRCRWAGGPACRRPRSRSSSHLEPSPALWSSRSVRQLPISASCC